MFAERLSQQPEHVKPRYGAACFADLPQTLIHLLTGQGAPALAPEILNGLAPTYDQVILILVDAFGWRFFERYQEDHPFLTEIAKAGVVARLTSQFPSTTAAHVTCIHTGLTPGQSGVHEWQYYEPQLDHMITPLLFSFAGELTGRRYKRQASTPDSFTLQRQSIPAYSNMGSRLMFFNRLALPTRPTRSR